jgi:hypothetical protein
MELHSMTQALTMNYNPNQNLFLKALADAIKDIKYRGVFVVAEGRITFTSADDLYRIEDAVVEGIASQGKLPSNSLVGGYQQINETLKVYNPETEVVILIDSVIEIMSREKIENAVMEIGNEKQV